MNEYELLIQLQDKYETTQTSSELKLLINTFLENFPPEMI